MVYTGPTIYDTVSEPPDDRRPATPERARDILRSDARWLAATWWRTELLGGTPRQRRRWEQQEDDRIADAHAHAAVLEDVAALPDEDLTWLLDSGWDPRTMMGWRA